MNIGQQIKKKLNRLINFMLKIITNKNTWLILSVGFYIYKLGRLPKTMDTSHFLQLLKESSSKIQELIFYDKLAVFRYLNTRYMCSVPLMDFALVDKIKAPFNCITGIHAIFDNPLNQMIIISAITGIIASMVFTKEFSKKEKPQSFSDTMTQDKIFEEFIANENVKNQIKIIIDQLKNPNKYKEKNIKLISGCLLFGKPGTGKTLLARCLSKLDGITFINTCASEFVEIYVGTGSKKVREIFELARQNQPAIIFIDEIESIGVKRASDHHSYTSNIERYSTLNQLLTELDGVVENKNILVIAATNREDLLDPALVRPGRFDYKINLSEPDMNLRINLFTLYLKKHEYDKEMINDEYILQLAGQTELFTGANIESIVNGAATICLNDDRQVITKEDLEISKKKNLEDFYLFRKHEY